MELVFKRKLLIKIRDAQLTEKFRNKYVIQVEYACCYNSGENVDFCEQKVMGTRFEYTAPSTPQQNGHVEWKFTKIFYVLYAMVNSEKFSAILRSSLWTEAANTATLLENNLFTPSKDSSAFQQSFGKGKRNILSLVQKFGEICITTYRHNSHWAKIANHGNKCI